MLVMLMLVLMLMPVLMLIMMMLMLMMTMVVVAMTTMKAIYIRLGRSPCLPVCATPLALTSYKQSLIR